MRLIAILFLASVLACRAADNVAGRWEGTVQIPGKDLHLVIDLAPDRAGAWTGSITIPSLNLKGASLAEITTNGANLSASIKDALSTPSGGPATMKVKLTNKGTLAGFFQQGGNTAPVFLNKTGSAQVDPPKRNTPIGTAFEGEWKGKYEMGGYPREVTLKLGNQAGTPAVDFVIVGKKVNNVPVALTTQDGDFLMIEAPTFGISYEGRFRRESGEIQGTLTQGPLEASLTLRRNP